MRDIGLCQQLALVDAIRKGRTQERRLAAQEPISRCASSQWQIGPSNRGKAAVTTRPLYCDSSSSRCTAMVIPFWISLIVILSMILVYISPRLTRMALAAALAVSVVVFMSGYTFLYFHGLRMHSDNLRGGLPYVMQYDTAPDDKLLVFHPIPQHARTLSQRLEQYRLGPFARLP